MGAYYLSRTRQATKVLATDNSPSRTATKKPRPAEKQRRIEDYLQVDPVELELGRNLVRLANRARNGDLLTQITNTREQVASDLGLMLPSVRVRDNLSLADNEYRIRFVGNLVAEGTIPRDGAIVIPPEGMKPRSLPQARPFAHPAVSSRAKMISPDRVSDARAQGCQVINPSQLVAQHLRRTAYDLSHELLTRDATQGLLDEVRKTSPAVVDELIPSLMKLGQVQQVLQGLLKEGIPIRQLPTILEALCDHRPETDNLAFLIELVRKRLARTISARYRSSDGQLHVVTLDPRLEQQLANSDVGMKELLSPKQCSTFQELLRTSLHRLLQENRPPVLLTRNDIRLAVRNLASTVVPNVVVLGQGEVTSDSQIRSVEIVGLS